MALRGSSDLGPVEIGKNVAALRRECASYTGAVYATRIVMLAAATRDAHAACKPRDPVQRVPSDRVSSRENRPLTRLTVVDCWCNREHAGHMQSSSSRARTDS